MTEEEREKELYYRKMQAQQRQEDNQLRNQQFNYMVEIGALDPQEEELQRKQAQIDMLRDRGMEGQEGRMVGNTFVAPSFTQYAAQLGNAYMARKGNEETKAGRADIAAKRAESVGKFADTNYSPEVYDPRKKRSYTGPV